MIDDTIPSADFIINLQNSNYFAKKLDLDFLMSTPET
jgi:hypothetical protein